MSPKEMRVRADECERLADSLPPTPDHLREMLREIASQWRRLADDGKPVRGRFQLRMRLWPYSTLGGSWPLDFADYQSFWHAAIAV
jgi:hypothetical protein